MPAIQVGKFHYFIPKELMNDFNSHSIQENVPTVVKGLKENIEHFSNLIKSELREHLYIFEDDGSVLCKIDGSRYATIVPDEIDAKSAGKITLHNHVVDASFSDADVKAACETNIKKLYLVNRKYKYSMERSSGKNFDSSLWDSIEKLYNKSYVQSKKELRNVDSTAYTELLDHLTWKKVCTDRHNDLIYNADVTTNGKDYFSFFRTVK